MDFFKCFFLLCLVFAVVMAHPSNDAKKLKKNKDNVRKPGLVRQKRQFGGFGGYPGGGGGFSNSFANAGASSFGFPGFGGSSSFANAGAGAGGFGRRKK